MIHRFNVSVRDSIVGKLWLTIVGMVALVMILLTFLLQQFFSNYLYQEQSRELARTAQSVQALVIANDPVYAAHVAHQLASVLQAKIDLSVPLTTDVALQTAWRSFTPAERTAFASGKPVSLSSSSGSAQTIAVYLIIPSGGLPGMIMVSQQTSVLQGPLVTMRNLLLLAMGLGIVLATGLAFVISKNLSRPLIQMHGVAVQMAQGNFDWRVEVVTTDEVGRLGRTLNSMAAELNGSIQALSMEKDQLSSILSSLQDGVIATDLMGNITLANPPAVKRLTSLNLAESGDAGLTSLPAGLAHLLEEVTQRRAPVVHEATWQDRQLIIRMTPLYDRGNSELRGIVSVFHDVTEERRLDRLRKDFLTNVSHELRTPLSMMQGYTEALLDDFGDDSAQRKEFIEIIHDETIRMRRLVTSLLDLAQLESGHFQMNFADADVCAVVRRVVRKFQALAHERGIHLLLDAQQEPLVVRADVDRLEQVFTNLVDNALRHTSQDGTVDLAVTQTPNYVNVRVSDTGSGIPPADLPYIWERFYKADKARTRGSSGIGLGLSITRHIVHAHGGDIIVDSQLHQGTVFTVAIPLRTDVS